MSKISCLLVILPFSSFSYAQPHFNRNDLYVESFGTPFSIVSINYERHFQIKPGFGFRAGVGYYDAGIDDNKFAVPVGINYLVRLNAESKSFLDFGMGATWSSEEGYKNPPVGRYATKDDFQNIFSYNVDAGFRQHLLNDKFMWRIDFALITNKYRTFLLPGLSAGYRF